ncbi:LVIVD repeat protein [Micromonospora sp. MW-13]|uniref:LVIVD repeat-containing protein n=1 Tax=Micromonospora sp. MW-13 TaxID=2094022 RepID=UPI000E444366|nr:LVIVD repeat protein [Micromonospora sp. MW-13]
MFRQTSRGVRRIGAVSLAAATALLVTAVAGAPAIGAPDASEIADNCESLREAGDNFAELCLSAAESDAQAAAEYTAPGVDEIASSPNLQQIANLPKSGAFAREASYSTDMAFQGNYAFVGNYDGFTIYDVSKPSAPQITSQVVCPGSQNDISVYGNLLFLSVDSSRNNDSCNSTSQSASIKSSWEGIRIFDVTDKASPAYVKAIETDCGSHTHTLVPGKNDGNLYVYVQSYSPSASALDCQPPHDKLSIIKVPLDNPTGAAVVATPNLFPGADGANSTSGCHDVTVYPELDLAAGACMGDGILMDIADRESPVVLSRVRDTNFAFWHSATFNNAGTKVVFTDELGGGSSATCNPTIGPKRGADAIFDIAGSGANRSLVFKSYFKIPRQNTSTENCVAHNGSLIPAMGRDIMVQAWYQGGISVWDFTDSANPQEIAYWERGPLSATRLILGGSWSTYYHNGYIYSSDIQKGLDVLKLTDPRTDNARAVAFGELNVQSQPSYPACTEVITDRRNGGLTVTSGVACLDGATVNGGVKVAPGAGLIAFNASINGGVKADGASVVSIVESRVNGSVTALGAKASVRDSKINGSVQIDG